MAGNLPLPCPHGMFTGKACGTCRWCGQRSGLTEPEREALEDVTRQVRQRLARELATEELRLEAQPPPEKAEPTAPAAPPAPIEIDLV